MLLLVRHGQASFGAADYDVLSETGFEQGRVLGTHLAGVLPAAPVSVVHGGMRRQRETAEALQSTAGWAVEAEVDDRWAEFDHLAVLEQYAEQGPEGLDRRGFQRLFEESTTRWQAESSGPGSWPEFLARVGGALDEVTATAGSGRTAVVVTSGGVVAAVAGLLTSGPTVAAAAWQRLNAVVVNTSVTRVLVGSTGARLLTFNEHGHLPAELVTYR